MWRVRRLHGHLAPRAAASASAAASGVERFLAARCGFAVVGASAERQKFGNKVLRCYMQHGFSVVPVSVKQRVIEGLACVASLKDLGKEVCDYGISVITPPKVTLQLLEEAKQLNVPQLWLQPGSESPEVLQRAKELDLGLIHSGPCVLVELGFDPSWTPPQASCGEAAEGALQWSLDEHEVFSITLSSAKTRNTLSRPVLEALRELLLTVPSRARVVVLQAQGNVFSAGHRFGDFDAQLPSSSHEETLKLCSEVNILLKEVPQPTIALVQGLATAAGCQLACSCDLIFAADSAAFSLPTSTQGMFCHTPAVAVATRSQRLALEMALLAEKVPALEAAQRGLVNRVLPRNKFQSEARKLVEKLAGCEPAQIQEGKRVFYEQISKGSLAERYQAAEPAMLKMFASPGSQAMLQKFRR